MLHQAVGQENPAVLREKAYTVRQRIQTFFYGTRAELITTGTVYFHKA